MNIRRKIRMLWWKYIGKYKMIDSTKWMKIPKTRYFILSEKQEKQVKELNWNWVKYIITPGPIGNSILVQNGVKDEIIDITDYSTW